MDIVVHLVHERATHFRRTYGEGFTIKDSCLDQNLWGRYPIFSEKRNKKMYKFDDNMTDFVTGAKGQGMRKWLDVDYVYYVINVADNHWILAQLCFKAWEIIVYDSDIACTTEETFFKLREPSSQMLPYLLTQAGFSPTKYKELQGTTPFKFWREPPSIVPQSKIRYI